MRFLMIMFPGPKAETGALPTQEELATMGQYNQELIQAGVLLAGEGLHPTSKGARVRFPGGKAVLTDGPFTEAKEIIGGYWLIQVQSREEAMEWARRIPGTEDVMVEVRQVYEMEDFGVEAQPQLEYERRFREEHGQ